MQVEPTVAVGLGATEVVEVTFAVVEVAFAVVVATLVAEVVVFTVVAPAVEVVVTAPRRQIFSLQEAPQILFASPVQAMEQSASAVFALAAGAEFEHQHSRP
jgi:hypothetical protein